MSDRAVQRLASAVLLQAINDATSRSAGRRGSALRWMQRNEESCYSFPFICRVLSRDPTDVRRLCERKLSDQQTCELAFPETIN